VVFVFHNIGSMKFVFFVVLVSLVGWAEGCIGWKMGGEGFFAL
jgi:hypothetical protein